MTPNLDQFTIGELRIKLSEMHAERDEARAERDLALNTLQQIQDMHGRPRTDRHGSGCIHCAIAWPCPTYLAAGGRRP